MGTLDSNGIYIYDTNDNVAPFSTLLNLGQSATSAALGQLEEDIFEEIGSLPEALTATGAASNEISSKGAWANLPGGNVVVTLNLAKRAWVDLTAGGVCVVPHNADLRVGINVIGATEVGLDSPTPGVNIWVRNRIGGELTADGITTKKVRLNAGQHTIYIRAQIAGDVKAKFEYPYLQVTPLRWAE